MNVQQQSQPLAMPRSGPVEGFENMGPEDVNQPRLMLAQSNTPQAKRKDAKYIQGLAEGMFFNSVTSQIYGEKVKLTPIMFFKSNLLFRDMDEGGGLLCRANDAMHGVGDPGGLCAKCPKFMWADNEPPECTAYFNYAALVIPDKGPLSLESLVIVSMKSTNLKLAKDWNSLMRLRQDERKQQLPMWRGIYTLQSEPRHEAQYSWHVAVPQNTGMHALGSPLGAICQDAYLTVRQMYAQRKLVVVIEEPTEEVI